MKPPKPDCYDYVRRYYGVPAYVGVRVNVRGREGVLVQSRPDQYLHIRFDGDAGGAGTYHPTDGIEYLVASQEGDVALRARLATAEADVARVNGMRCHECKHWTPPAPEDPHGWSYRLHISTDADFGCLAWEKRDG